MRKLVLLASCVYTYFPLHSQGLGTVPSTPILPQAATLPQYGNFGEANVQSGTFNNNLQNPMGFSPSLNGDDLQNIRRRNEAMIQTDLANTSFGNNDPNNSDRELFRFMQYQINHDNIRVKQRDADLKAQEQPFKIALQSIKDMFTGKRNLSIADAYYLMECAYGEVYLSQQEYKAIIKKSADFIKTWMLQQGLDVKDNIQVNYAIQQFMSQNLSITNSLKQKDGHNSFKTISHIPFTYDYIDYKGLEDHRNYFLTKCLATGSGQCNSLPAVYLVLAESLGATAYLSIAPNHSFIKYPDNHGNIYNYEPTSNWNISDQWYQDNLFISQEAIKNGTYLAPLGKDQIIADATIQLTFGYISKIGVSNEVFINECLLTAESHFPLKNHLAIYFTYGNIYAYKLAQAMRRNNITRLSEIDKSTETKAAYEQWQQNEQTITNLGFQKKPQYIYERMMQNQEFKGRLQKEQHNNGKAKRNLFIQSN